MMQLKCEDYYDATYICKIGHFGAKYGYYVIFEHTITTHYQASYAQSYSCQSIVIFLLAYMY